MEMWKEYKLGTLTERKIGYGIVQPGEDTPGGVPVIKVNNIISGLTDITKLERTSISNDLKYSRTKLRGGELIISVVGTIGRTAIVPSNFKGCNLVRATALIDILDPQLALWVKYYIDSPKGQSYIKENLNTTVQPTLNVKSLVEMPIPLFSTNYRNKVIKILKALDDKIECNRKINENLEAQAQALFKSWFVDFEPFRDGPFVESELGPIPQGWKVGKLGELCQFKRGKGLLSKNAIPGKVPVVAGGLEPSCYHNASNTESPVVTVSGSGANAGFMRMYHQKVWASDCSFIDSTCENLLFVFCFLSTNRRLLKHAQTGAVQPHVKPSDIHDFDLVIPPKEIIDRFQELINDSISLIGNNKQESRQLGELRDALLPRLMSGELKVSDVKL